MKDERRSDELDLFSDFEVDQNSCQSWCRKKGHLSFPIIHKVGNVVNFALLRSEGFINLSKRSLPPVGFEPASLTP